MTCFVVQGHIFCNILNVLTVTFDQFIASLLNKIFNFFKKKGRIDLKHFNILTVVMI